MSERGEGVSKMKTEQVREYKKKINIWNTWRLERSKNINGDRESERHLMKKNENKRV